MQEEGEEEVSHVQSCTLPHMDKKADQVKEVKTPVGVLPCKVPSEWQQYINIYNMYNMYNMYL